MSTEKLNAEKTKALENAMRQIEKDFGKGSIMKLGEASAKMNIEVIPTGALSLDIALGVGGIPRGRVIEIYGPESSGKTTVARLLQALPALSCPNPDTVFLICPIFLFPPFFSACLPMPLLNQTL